MLIQARALVMATATQSHSLRFLEGTALCTLRARARVFTPAARAEFYGRADVSLLSSAEHK